MEVPFSVVSTPMFFFKAEFRRIVREDLQDFHFRLQLRFDLKYTAFVFARGFNAIREKNDNVEHSHHPAGHLAITSHGLCISSSDRRYV